MTPEQSGLFSKLTRLQKRVCLNVLEGMPQQQAYFEAGGKAKDRSMGAYEILANPQVCRFMDVMERAAADSALCVTVDIVEGLMKEAGLIKNKEGQRLPAPSDSTQAGRVSALKALSEFTGGFDKNKKQIEHSGYIERPLDELYGED